MSWFLIGGLETKNSIHCLIHCLFTSIEEMKLFQPRFTDYWRANSAYCILDVVSR